MQKKYIQKKKKLIYDVISSKNYAPMRQKDIAMLLDIPKERRAVLAEILELLEAEGKILKMENGRYIKARKKEVLLQKAYRQAERKADRKYTGRKKDEKRQKTDRPYEKKRPETDSDQIDDILMAYGIVPEFPAAVEKQAEKCKNTVTEKEAAGRLDLRDWKLVTIDGIHSKDLDDAVSVLKREDGFLLGVHIADVADYVQAKSALDKEAFKRGTSVYLCDRVIPMLPKKLSNGICSLNEGEDRLALSCIMKMDWKGNITSSKIRETVIRVSKRLSYPQVDAVFQGEQEAASGLEEYLPMLEDLRQAARLLWKSRIRRGTIQFEFPETEIETDAQGHPIRVHAARATEATRLIEVLMLAANEAVAETFFQKGLPFVYRVHEHPDNEQIEEAFSLARSFGMHPRKTGSTVHPSDVNAVLSEAEGTPHFNLISMKLLRSMKQARYSDQNEGHFGLASDCYCHFTSPIRRYPDLQIHRIIKDYLRGRLHDKKASQYRSMLEQVAWRSSAMERRAVEVERETNKLKLAEYMRTHLGECFDSMISGVTAWGIYVQLENTIEGLVHMSRLKDDFYLFDEERQQLIGKAHGRVFELGQMIRVRAIDADTIRRTIDFELAEE